MTTYKLIYEDGAVEMCAFDSLSLIDSPKGTWCKAEYSLGNIRWYLSRDIGWDMRKEGEVPKHVKMIDLLT